MRMIKSGHYSKAPWTGTASCPDCMALMAIEEADLRIKQNMVAYVTCMDCGCRIDLLDVAAPPMWVLRRISRDHSKP